MKCFCCTCVIILSFPLLVWPSLQPSPPWWTTTSATTTWGRWSLSQGTHHPRSPRPGTRQSPATCWGRKTSQGRWQTGSSVNDTLKHYAETCGYINKLCVPRTHNFVVDFQESCVLWRYTVDQGSPWCVTVLHLHFGAHCIMDSVWWLCTERDLLSLFVLVRTEFQTLTSFLSSGSDLALIWSLIGVSQEALGHNNHNSMEKAESPCVYVCV